MCRAPFESPTGKLSLLVLTSLVTTADVSYCQEPAGDSTVVYQDDVGKMVWSGAGFGVIGWAGGALVGVLLSGSFCSGDEYCALSGALLGGAAGGTFGIAYGVHHANERRGNLALDIVTAAGVWTAGIIVASATGYDEPLGRVIFLTVPLVQIGTAVAVEKAVARKRVQSGDLSIRVVPALDGSVGLIVSATF